MPPHRALGGEGRHRPLHDRHVGRGAATVEGEYPVEAGVAGQLGRSQCAGGRSGQHRGDRLVAHGRGRDDATVAPHDVERWRLAVSQPVELGLDSVDVADHLALHEGIHERGDRPLVLPVFPQHVRADRHRRLRILGGDELGHPLLVGWVQVGVEEAHPDRMHPVLTEEPDLVSDRRLVERSDHLPLGVQALRDLSNQLERNDPVGLDPEVRVAVSVGDALAGDLEYVPEALGGEEPQPLGFVFEQRVGGDGRPVTHRGDVVGGALRLVEDQAKSLGERHPPGRTAPTASSWRGAHRRPRRTPRRR